MMAERNKKSETGIKVFFSYSHDSDAHKQRVLALSNRLRQDGVDCRLDQYETSPPGGWPQWCMQQMREADAVLLVFTEPYFRRCTGQEKPGEGQGSKFEFFLTVQDIYESHCRTPRFIPVVFDKKHLQYIPDLLKGFSHYVINAGGEGYTALYRHLTRQPEVVPPPLGSMKEHPPRAVDSTVSLPGPGSGSVPGGGLWLTGRPPRNVRLFGRDKDAAKLAEALERDNAVVLVNGLGGIGKTELCKQYAWENRDRYDVLAWVDYLDNLEESLVRSWTHRKPGVGADLNRPLRERFEAILSYLRNLPPSRLLLVVDNLGNPDEKLLETLRALPGTILVSSRRRLKGFPVQGIGFLGPGDCLELFYCHCRCGRDDEVTREVVRRAGYHTMTVELLAKTADKEGLSLSQLLDRLEKHGFNLDGVIPAEVDTLWGGDAEADRFFRHLCKVFEISVLTEEEMEVLVHLSLLPETMGFELQDIGKWLGAKAPSTAAELADGGWLLREESRVAMHPVIGEVVRCQSPSTVDRCRDFIKKINRLLRYKAGENPLDKGPYVPLGVSILERLKAEDLDIALLAHNVSRIYRPLGQLEKALEYQLKTVDIFKKILDPQHSFLATSYNNLSTIYHDQGQLEKALEYQLKATETRKKILDPQHPDLARSYNNLSLIYQEQGQLEKALEYQLKATEIKKKILIPEHPSLATSYNNLSLIYQDQGQLEKALEYQLKATETRKKTLDPQHPSLATSYNNLSLIYKAQGKKQPAVTYAQKAVNIMEPLFPNGHYKLDIYKRTLAAAKKMGGKQ